jgi:hypothetical protein
MNAAEEIQYLLAGDPAIRWQTMRDLMDAPHPEWEAERQRIPHEGWGAQFIFHQHEDGSWPNARWTGTVWTLTLLVDLGMPTQDDRFAKAFDHIVRRLMPKGTEISEDQLFKELDLCHLGFWFRCGSHFCPDDARLPIIASTLLNRQFADGGWNCRERTKPKTRHSSFHTTLNVLEGLRIAAEAEIVDTDTFQTSEARAIEFLLEHKLYRSDKTGEVVDDRFLDLAFPSYWHYNVLRGLDYIRQTPFIRDERLTDPIAYLQSRKKTNGRWPVEKRIPGVTLFDMEPMGKDSRWNTLRALRVLKASADFQ